MKLDKSLEVMFNRKLESLHSRDCAVSAMYANATDFWPRGGESIINQRIYLEFLSIVYFTGFNLISLNYHIKFY